MEKLSELREDTMLTVQIGNGDINVMSKKDFMNSSEYLDREPDLQREDYPEVTIGVPQVADFSFEYALECAGDEMYEDWKTNVTYSLEKQGFDFKGIEKVINKVFAEHPTYYVGKLVDIDN
ncbi:hypothetical protein [Muricomes intestini]|jgi:hypothetical protein|uniref:hypothetical protein n=1 Tax=Muricomes intestini TaxID=1796634 RepID=UPI002FDD6917